MKPTATATLLALGAIVLWGTLAPLGVLLQHVPPVQANLVNYLWPLGIVLMAPLFLPGMRLRALHVAAALLGFAGAVLAILGGGSGSGDGALQGGFAWGYIPALASAFVWASYSLMTQRVRRAGRRHDHWRRNAGFPGAVISKNSR